MARDPIAILLILCLIAAIITLWSTDLHADYSRYQLFRTDWSGR